MPKMAGAKINLKLIPIKAHFFLYFGGVAAVWPFINVFAKQLGISSAGIGLIFSAAPILGLIAKPLFGAIGDRFKKKKTLFLFFVLLNLVSLVAVGFLPQSSPERPVNFLCSYAGSYIKQCGVGNALCNQSLIERINPPSGNGSDRVEVCQVRCEISSFKEGQQFCQSVGSRANVPSLCNMDTTSFMEVGAVENATLTEGTSHIKHPHFYRPDFEATTVMAFTAWLQMRDAEILRSESDPEDSCLHLKVDTISYDDRPNESLAMFCMPTSILSECFIDCPDNKELNNHLERILEAYDVFESMNFFLYGTLVIIAFVAMAVVCSMGDALCFALLDDKPQLYGVQRQFGAMGWGLVALVAGYLIDYSSEGKLLKDYTPAFYLMAALLALDLAVSYKLDVKETEKPKAWRKSLSSLLSDLRVIVMIAACIIIGMCTGLQWYFLFWHVDELASSQETCGNGSSNQTKTLLGLMTAVQSFLGEVPFFHFSGWFIRKLGHVNCITIVLGVFGIRFIIYSLIVNPWTILPVELLQGFTYGIFYATMTSYADRISPRGMSATVQGVFGSAFEGLGVAAGSLIGGLMFYRYNGSIVFRIFGCGAFVFCFLFFLAMLVLGREKSYLGVSLGIRENEGQEMRQITASNLEVDSE